ncbi:hypothetical protein [Bifidobacterium choloepi]|uniref:Transmembrane protein n=1 Tax=Bifidobacterium choloepi TaxID=2614131 RepID=A0A6I5ND71_9BIFI|nr:hypothetical protein [Bifidobacterium choloepi]NEG70490.1 hypothetical protein [Bifidobacterium choloepi]
MIHITMSESLDDRMARQRQHIVSSHMTTAHRVLADTLPHILLSLALIFQLLIVTFLTVLSIACTAYIIRVTKGTGEGNGSTDILTNEKTGEPILYGPEFLTQRMHFYHGWPSAVFWLGLLVMIAIVVGAALLSSLQRVPERTVRNVMLTVVAIVQLAWVAMMNTQAYPAADTKSLAAIANAWNAGDISQFAKGACNVNGIDGVSTPAYYCASNTPAIYTYLHLYPFQAGPAMWFALVFKIFGADNYVAFQMVNAACMVIIVACLWSLTGMLMSDSPMTVRKAFSWNDSSHSRTPRSTRHCRSSLTTLVSPVQLPFAILTITCVPLMMMCSFCYTNMAGFMFVLLGVVILAKSTDIRRPLASVAAIIAGFSLCAAGVVFKTTFIIIVLAAIIAVVFTAWRMCCYWQMPVAIVLGALTTKATIIPEHILERFAGYSFGDGMPMSSWLVIGLRERPSTANATAALPGANMQGFWTGIALDIFNESNGNLAEQKAITNAFLTQRFHFFLTNLDAAFSFFLNKFEGEWAEPTFQSRYFSELSVSGSSFDGLLAKILSADQTSLFSGYVNVCQSLLYLLAFVGLIFLLARFLRQHFRSLPIPTIFTGTFLTAAFIGGFTCYIVWEAKGVYTFPFFLLLFPMAAYGAGRLGNCLGTATKVFLREKDYEHGQALKRQ